MVIATLCASGNGCAHKSLYSGAMLSTLSGLKLHRSGERKHGSRYLANFFVDVAVPIDRPPHMTSGRCVRRIEPACRRGTPRTFPIQTSRLRQALCRRPVWKVLFKEDVVAPPFVLERAGSTGSQPTEANHNLELQGRKLGLG